MRGRPPPRFHRGRAGSANRQQSPPSGGRVKLRFVASAEIELHSLPFELLEAFRHHVLEQPRLAETLRLSDCSKVGRAIFADLDILLALTLDRRNRARRDLYRRLLLTLQKRQHGYSPYFSM